MKEYVNLLFSIIDKIDGWDEINNQEKSNIFRIYIEEASNYDVYVNYFQKYINFLRKNTFKNLSKDILPLN